MATRVDGQGRVNVDATKPVSFGIYPEHVVGAVPRSPTDCVLARAMNDVEIWSFDSVHVGVTITKVVQGNRVTRYATPAKLAAAVIEFDKGGPWTLPPGIYTLRPPSPYRQLGADHTSHRQALAGRGRRESKAERASKKKERDAEIAKLPKKRITTSRTPRYIGCVPTKEKAA